MNLWYKRKQSRLWDVHQHDRYYRGRNLNLKVAIEELNSAHGAEDPTKDFSRFATKCFLCCSMVLSQPSHSAFEVVHLFLNYIVHSLNLHSTYCMQVPEEICHRQQPTNNQQVLIFLWYGLKHKNEHKREHPPIKQSLLCSPSCVPTHSSITKSSYLVVIEENLDLPLQPLQFHSQLLWHFFWQTKGLLVNLSHLGCGQFHVYRLANFSSRFSVIMFCIYESFACTLCQTHLQTEIITGQFRRLVHRTVLPDNYLNFCWTMAVFSCKLQT